MNQEFGIWKATLDSRFLILKFLAILTLTLLTTTSHAEQITTSHGLSAFGDLKYPKDFKHFEYANQNAPKGGSAKIAYAGTFDSINPYIMKGVAAAAIELTSDTLMEPSADESFSEYGLIAESAETPKDGGWVIFNLRKEAKWQDGTNITADDVVFSFNTLKEKGHPKYKSLYRDITSAEKLGERRVKFTIADKTNRELPLIAGQVPVISKAYYTNHEFDKDTMEIPLSSGPYKIKSMEAGRSITYERNPNYWGKNLNVNIGRYNFSTIRVDYYRDDTVLVEAFKAGEYDFRKENIAKTWAKSYNLPHIKDGRIIKEELTDGTPTGMQCFAMNIRRSKFQNPKVREALNYAYDFEWANKQLFFSAYSRNVSYFGNSEFGWQGLPSQAELKLLEPFKDSLPPQIFTQVPEQPNSEKAGSPRANLLKAQALLDEAGWTLHNMKRINPETGEPFTIEFLLSSASFERVVAPYARNLKKLGIDSTIRTVDSSQYIKRLQEFDYDITVHWFLQGPSPGTEQINYWHSKQADIAGSANVIGIKNSVVDAMVDKIITAPDKPSVIAATRALDRILLWNYYSIPQWHSRNHRVIYWNKFGHPEITPPYSRGFVDIFLSTWWVDNKKEQELLKKVNN
jgi:microcin C transport system substrate-binding protein